MLLRESWGVFSPTKYPELEEKSESETVPDPIDSFHISGRPWQPRTLSAIGWPTRTANFVLALSTDERHFRSLQLGLSFLSLLTFFYEMQSPASYGCAWTISDRPRAEQSRCGGSRRVVCLHKDVVRRCLHGKQPRKLPWHRKLVPRKEAWQGKKFLSLPWDLQWICHHFSSWLSPTKLAVVDSVSFAWPHYIYADNVQSSTLVIYMHPDLHHWACMWKLYTKENMQSTRLKKKNKKLTIEQCKRQKENWLWRVCSPLHTKSTSK